MRRFRKGSIKRIILLFFAIIAAIGGIYGWQKYDEFTAIPTTRLPAGGYYPEIPPDGHHHYLQLPIDHQQPSNGTFTDFYILSPDFKPGDNVVFWLFDNQQEHVGMLASPNDFGYFERNLNGLSYVLIGNRGVSPTLFPEVFHKDGSINYPLAMKLYGSEQQIDDIEAVRQDMQSKGLLPADGKIMIYGGSGGGFLVQQYLDKYGGHVSKALIEYSGAPDLAKNQGLPFMNNTISTTADLAKSYFSLKQKGEPMESLAYMLYKIGLEGNTDLQKKVLQSRASAFALREKLIYLKSWLTPANNYPIVNFMLNVPSELEVKVRIYELTGSDLENYHPTKPEEINMGYEWIQPLLADFMNARNEGQISPPQFKLNRSSYMGEVMVWAGTNDQTFGPDRGLLLSDSYPHAKLAIFNDSHLREKDPEYYRSFRKAFFTYGLESAQTKQYFSDERQLNRAVK